MPSATYLRQWRTAFKKSAGHAYHSDPIRAQDVKARQNQHTAKAPPPSPYRVTDWYDTCPRCGGVCSHEPGASKCRSCARVFYIPIYSAAQADFERRSGMTGARELVMPAGAPPRFGPHEGAE